MRHVIFSDFHCSWLFGNLKPRQLLLRNNLFLKLNIQLFFNDCCYSLSGLVARELYWLLWLQQYEALNGYYAQICFKIATVDCMNKIICRNIMKMQSVYRACPNDYSPSIPFNFFYLFLVLSKNRQSIFDIFPAKLLQSLRTHCSNYTNCSKQPIYF